VIAGDLAGDRTPMAGADHEQVTVPRGDQLMQRVTDRGAVDDQDPRLDGSAGTLVTQHPVRRAACVGAVGRLDRIDMRERYPRPGSCELPGERDRVAPTLATINSNQNVAEHCVSSKLCTR